VDTASEPLAPAGPHRPTFGAEAEGSVVRFRSQDGLLLAARIFDVTPSERLPLLCLPGLSRNSRDFIGLGRFFARHASEPRKVVAVDYRGRGLSEPDRDWRNYKPLVEAHDVLAAATVLGIERAILIGSSRGGIVAMLLGALRPALIAGVILNDIGPVVEGTGLARIKKYLGSVPAVRDWDEALDTLRRGAGAQFPGLSEEDWRRQAEAYFAESGSGIAPQFDRNLLRSIGDLDLSERLPVLWPQFMSLAGVPVLAIRGEHSDVLSPRTLVEMAERHPQFEHLTVRGQGHTPLLRDAPTLERILTFAQRCDEPADS
jgi:pimeloyl-ACP methyl ester carboxylesterase